MVAGKVRIAMGLHKSPGKGRKKDHASTPPPPPKPSSVVTNSDGKPANSSDQRPVFSRSFGVYFPRSSSQVHATRSPPDHHDLRRQVEELRERESLLRTELLELKLLKESVSIIPILEAQISNKDFELDRYSMKVEALEAENQRLRREMEEVKEKSEEQRRESEKRVKEMENEVSELKKTLSDKESEEHSASQRFQGLMEASAKSNLIKNLKRVGSFKVAETSSNLNEQEATMTKSDRSSHSRSNSEELSESTLAINLRSRAPRIPKPPPRPSSSSASLPSASSSRVRDFTSNVSLATEKPIPPPPPPPAKTSKSVQRHPPPTGLETDSKPSPSTDAKSLPPPPPPPPLPPKSLPSSATARMRRVPEVVEFYHSLMRRDTNSRRDSGGGTEALATASARDMIGEIENRSTHLLAIKTDVETQGDFVKLLIKEVQNAAFTDIEDVVPFVKWLDDELSYLVDERAVLKHFDWPEQKADALREAAFTYCDLKKLEAEASSFRDDPRQPCGPALKKMQALLEKLEHSIYNLSRMRESAANRYKGFQIPVNWMLNNGIITTQIKLASVKLAIKYMKRVSGELETVGGGPEKEELIVQGVRFAFRVHQFAGGFDVETMRAFQELRDKARSCHVQCQNHNQSHQKIMCRSTTC